MSERREAGIPPSSERGPSGPAEGHERANMSSPRTVRVAIAGIGNCANSLVQGVEYYRDADPTERVPGLMHVVLGGYHVHDVEFVAAFDVDAAKVGLDLGKAIHASQNNTIKFANVGHLGVEVQRAPTFDGLGTYYRTQYEMVLFGCLGPSLATWMANHDEADVWRVPRDARSEYEHPAQKPVALAARAIRNSSKAGDLVLDPFAGSGSTLRAAKDAGRRAIGVEVEERYCEVAARRCSQEVLFVLPEAA